MPCKIPERQWDKPAPAPHPEPEVPQRTAADGEIPKGARTLRAFAERHGWTIVATYARGTKPGRSPKVVDSVALCMHRGGARAWATWLDGKFDAAQIRPASALPLNVNLTALRGQLSLPAGQECAA